MLVRDLTAHDLDQVVELNDAAYPAVPITAIGEMADLLRVAGFASAAVDPADESTVLGFVIGMRPGSGYASENFRYFQSRGTNFLYVDRIVVNEATRGSGVGRMLYVSVFDLARVEGRAEVTCEVNLLPPNPESLAFHARLGFERVGEQDTKNGSVRVALLAAAV
ncbi:MAG TPA: GNAT family N-acetyltransferase [Microbacteriaceae bacterium]|jgi:predicted GNAT superfamily acetyltransferase|nr:GNAT family N-acetyltransferase [Microbacteriaceae bacterium]